MKHLTPEEIEIQKKIKEEYADVYNNKLMYKLLHAHPKLEIDVNPEDPTDPVECCIALNNFGLAPRKDETARDDMSLFTYIVIMGHIHLAEAIMKTGVPVDEGMPNGFFTPLLTLASQRDPSKNQIKMATLLIQYGANLRRNADCCFDSFYNTTALFLSNYYKNTPLSECIQKAEITMQRNTRHYG